MVYKIISKFMLFVCPLLEGDKILFVISVLQKVSSPVTFTIATAQDLMFPSLASFDWRIDIKSASDSVAQMSIPTVLVQMDVDTPKQHVDDENGRRVVTFEMTNEMLSTMLEGMRFVRVHLANIK